MKDFIHAHKYSDLHDGVNIIYSIATPEKIHRSFDIIKSLKKPVILITANADTTIDDYWANLAPNNLHLWFAQNGISNNPKIRIIPEGLQPSYPSKTGDIGYEIAVIKEQVLDELVNTPPQKFIYANFAVGTNPPNRGPIKDLCEKIDFIDWDSGINFSSYESYNNVGSIRYFYNKINEYRAVVCPIGNGLDTHRVYETLYCGRIPITFQKELYELMYKNFPIVYLDSVDKLSDKSLLESLIRVEEGKIWDKNLLTFSYWKNLIDAELQSII